MARLMAGRRPIHIGSYPDLTIEQRRTRARELLGDIARGYNPAEERRAVRQPVVDGVERNPLATRSVGNPSRKEQVR
jgi:hypothetical protein